MKKITVYSLCAVTFLIILFFVMCGCQNKLSLQQLAAQIHLKVNFPKTVSHPIPIGVYIVANDSISSCLNLEYEKKLDVYVLADSNEICSEKLESNTVNIYTYAPYREGRSSIEKHQVSVSLNQNDSANYRASDFMYAMSSHEYLSSDILNLSLKPKLAKFVINIKRAGVETSKDVFFDIVGVVTSANINLTTEVFSDLEDPKNINPFRKQNADASFDYTLEAILIPQRIEAGKTLFVFRVEGKEYHYKLKYDTVLESSMQYTWNIIINGDDFLVELKEMERTDDDVSNNIGTVSQRRYDIGDFYPIADDPLSAVGVVFSTTNNGLHGKIVSLNEVVCLKWGPLVESGSKSRTSGISNKKVIIKQTQNIADYEALDWCLSKGKDWYLPAINELVDIFKQKKVLNNTLSPMLRSNSLDGGVYLSSTEESASTAFVFHFGNGHCIEEQKSSEFKVRAVCEF